MPSDSGPLAGCGECSPIPHEGGYGRCECECHDTPTGPQRIKGWCGFERDGQVVVASGQAAIDLAVHHDPFPIFRLAEDASALLRAVVVAANRMRDDWAEADDAVKKRLWSELHAAAEAAENEVYPL